MKKFPRSETGCSAAHLVSRAAELPAQAATRVSPGKCPMKQGDHEAITQAERDTWNRSAARYLESAAELTRHAVPWLLDACQLTKDSHLCNAA